ncbi:multi antimicrobial extrusion protein, partial [Tanacetum coccineum]
MGSAVETLCGQAYGAHQYEMLGVYLQRSTILLMATAIPLICGSSSPCSIDMGCIVRVGLGLIRTKNTWIGFSIQAFYGLWAFLKLSTSSTVMLCLEAWYFQILVLIAGLLENPEIALDSLAVCATILGCVMMISVRCNAVARYAFTDGEVVANDVSKLTPLLTVSIFDGIQPVIS